MRLSIEHGSETVDVSWDDVTVTFGREEYVSLSNLQIMDRLRAESAADDSGE